MVGCLFGSCQGSVWQIFLGLTRRYWPMHFGLCKRGRTRKWQHGGGAGVGSISAVCLSANAPCYEKSSACFKLKTMQWAAHVLKWSPAFINAPEYVER